MAEVMIQEKEDAAAWLLTLHGEELMQEAAVPKKIVAEDFFLWRNCCVIQSNCRRIGYKSKATCRI